MLTASLLYNLAGTMPLWLEGMWTQLSFLRAQLRNDYNRSVENQIKRLIGTHAPDYSWESSMKPLPTRAWEKMLSQRKSDSVTS